MPFYRWAKATLCAAACVHTVARVGGAGLALPKFPLRATHVYQWDEHGREPARDSRANFGGAAAACMPPVAQCKRRDLPPP